MSKALEVVEKWGEFFKSLCSVGEFLVENVWKESQISPDPSPIPDIYPCPEPYSEPYPESYPEYYPEHYTFLRRSPRIAALQKKNQPFRRSPRIAAMKTVIYY